MIVGKVARLEYPLDWPEVFSELTSIIRDASLASDGPEANEVTILRLMRSLSILLHILKELATGRLSRTKANLQAVTPEVFRVLGAVYVRHVDIWQGLLGQQPVPARTADMMSISLLCLKILRRLVVAGYEFLNRIAEVQELWQILSGQVWALFSAESHIPTSDEEVVKLLRKHVVNTGKLFLDVSLSHPAAFALLPGTLPLLGKYWEVVVAHGETLVQQSKQTIDGSNSASDGKIEEQERRAFREKVALQGMLLFRSCSKMIFSPVSTFKCLYTSFGTTVYINLLTKFGACRSTQDRKGREQGGY